MVCGGDRGLRKPFLKEKRSGRGTHAPGGVKCRAAMDTDSQRKEYRWAGYPRSW